MTDENSVEKPKAKKPSTRELIYGAILVFGFILIASGLNGTLEWGLPELAINAIGAVAGLAAAVALSWLRNK